MQFDLVHLDDVKVAFDQFIEKHRLGATPTMIARVVRSMTLTGHILRLEDIKQPPLNRVCQQTIAPCAIRIDLNQVPLVLPDPSSAGFLWGIYFTQEQYDELCILNRMALKAFCRDASAQLDG